MLRAIKKLSRFYSERVYELSDLLIGFYINSLILCVILVPLAESMDNGVNPKSHDVLSGLGMRFR